MSSMDIDASHEYNNESMKEEVIKENGDHSESPTVPFFNSVFTFCCICSADVKLS
jgi:hypothetical protein